MFASFAGTLACDSAFSRVRGYSRLGPGFIYVLAMGELPPTLLARLVECSEPGALKMLRQLVDGGFLVAPWAVRIHFGD